MVRIYEQKYVTLDYEPSIPCVISTSLRFMMLKEFKSQLNFGYNFMKEKNEETGRMVWIADATLAETFNENDVKWLVEDWTRYIETIGIRYLALVVPESEFAQIAIDDYNNRANESKGKKVLNITFFKDVESAKKWFGDMNS